jgi:hypothetical protein
LQIEKGNRNCWQARCAEEILKNSPLRAARRGCRKKEKKESETMQENAVSGIERYSKSPHIRKTSPETGPIREPPSKKGPVREPPRKKVPVEDPADKGEPKRRPPPDEDWPPVREPPPKERDKWRRLTHGFPYALPQGLPLKGTGERV